MTVRQLPLPFPKGEGSGVGFGGNAQCPMTAWHLPLPFPKGEGSGVGFGSNAQCIMPNACLASSPPLSQRGGARGGVWKQCPMRNACLASCPSPNKLSADFVIFQIISKKYSRFIRVIRGFLLFQRPLSQRGRQARWNPSLKRYVLMRLFDKSGCFGPKVLECRLCWVVI